MELVVFLALEARVLVACRFESDLPHQYRLTTYLHSCIINFNQRKMMKPTATFRLTKRSKTIAALARFKDQEQRDAFRGMMIQAQLAAAVVQRSPKERDAK